MSLTFAKDEETKVIAGFLEGFRNAEKFLKICKKNVNKKPIIILKAGTTSAGTKAASSHTGSITGSMDVYDAAFKQYGVIKANNFDELLDLIRAFYYIKPKRGNRVAIVPGAGGIGVGVAGSSAARPAHPTTRSATKHRKTTRSGKCRRFMTLLLSLFLPAATTIPPHS